MKKMIFKAAALVLSLALLVSCDTGGSSSEKKPPKDSVSTIINTEDASGDVSSGDFDNVSSAEQNAGSRPTVSDTEYTSDESYVSDGASSSDSGDTIELACEDHPGVPGFDAKMAFKCYVNGRLANNSNFTLSTDNKNVKLEKNILTVPASIKDKGATIIVKAALNSDPSVTDTYPIKFKTWEYTMNDEFEGDKVNEKYWSCRYSWPSEKAERSNPANMIVEDGMLKMRADKIPFEGAEYSHIFMHTQDKFTQTYGCFTSRIKVADKGGTNTAFWLLPNEGNWGQGYMYRHIGEDKWCGEVDLLETSPDKSTWNNDFQVTLHNWREDGSREGAGGWSSRFPYPEDTHFDFHEYSCVWTTNAMYFYFDGELLYAQHSIEATGNPAYLILDLELAAHEDTGNWDWCGTYKDSDLPVYAYVDYVKVYK